MAIYQDGAIIQNAINQYNARTSVSGNSANRGSGTVYDESKVDEEQGFSSPTSIIDKDPLSFQQLSYPRDVTQDMANGHYMLFYVNVQNKTKYKYTGGADGKPVGGYVSMPDRALDALKNKDSDNYIGYRTNKDPYDYELDYKKGLVQRGGKGNYNSSNEVVLTPNTSDRMGGLSSVHNTTTRITDSVALYLPADVKDSTSATYQDAMTGIVGLVAAGGGAFLDAMKRNDYQSASKSLIGGVRAISEAALQKVGGEFVDLIAGVEGSADLANKAFGQATNPYMEVIFDQMNTRSFQYNFTFSPRNAAETEDVQRIIKLFRFHMAPELKGAQQRFLTLPSTFDIHYMYNVNSEIAKENNFYSKIATCVLQNVDVNYTPNGVKSFADGAPTQITMNLSFMETELLTKQKINAGF